MASPANKPAIANPKVKPLIDQQSAIQRQGNSLQQLQQQYTFGMGNGPAGPEENNRVLSTTGHAVRFFNYGSYFPLTAGGRTGGTGGLGGQGGQTQFTPYRR